VTLPQPLYPIFIPSKSRAEIALTPAILDIYETPYRIIVERHQAEAYAAKWGEERILILPRRYQTRYDTLDDLGSSKSYGPGPARNYAWDIAEQEGAEWHWVMDDNIQCFARLHENERIDVRDSLVICAMEEYTRRWSNVGMAGPNYWMFAPSRQQKPPFSTGTRIYSCNLIRTRLPQRWRGRYNEDTILSLDLLKAGWNTIQYHTFLQFKVPTQIMGGGNAEAFYDAEGTRPKSAMLVKAHPDVARIAWRFRRWHHVVDYSQYQRMGLIPDEAYEPRSDLSWEMIRQPRTHTLPPLPGGWTGQYVNG